MVAKYSGLILFLVVGISSVALGVPADNCVPANCTLPNCRCSSQGIPGGLTSGQVPQLVFLSFDAAVNVDNYAFYNDILTGRKNPNGQPITITFFVSHDYTNYTMIHDLYRRGHEIGLHSISTNTNQAYWQALNETEWRSELVDQREQLATFAKVPPQEIVGARSPQLIVGGDKMYSVLNAARIKYDCSRPSNDNRRTGLWPYTNDFKSTQDCVIPPCPIEQHKAFWTVPILNHEGGNGSPCSLVDQCEPVPETANATYDLLYSNFQSHHGGHRAPFGLYLRSGWVNGTANDQDPSIQERRAGYIRFLDHLSTLNDVYIVSIARGLQWVQNPTPLANVSSFPAFQVTVKNSQCPQNFPCLYRAGETPFKPPFAEERAFHSCVSCPTAYPWVGNHLGRNPYP